MLESLRLQNFRSFADQEFEISDKTLIIGDNGTGKSTLIEAIRLLSVNKSFRTSRLDEAIRFEERFLRLGGNFKNKKDNKLEFFYGTQFENQGNKERAMTVNGQVVNLMEHIGQFPSVLFVPTDVDIVLGSPNLRRKYLDGVLWQTSPEFRQQFLELQRVLKERAQLLFLLKIKRAGLDELRPWNELLEALTMSLRAARVAYVAYLSETLAGVSCLAQTELTFEFEYKSEVENMSDVQDEEIRLAQNLYGPHRDELIFKINDKLARTYASRGQARTLTMILKIIELRYLANHTKNRPMVLLDDIFSELDRTNAEYLFGNLSGDWQVIASALTEQEMLADFKVIKL